jgi:hypothetical protein
MPIRLNLLAEARAAEEMRRRDPVKRALWVAALVIVLILVWSSSLQLKAMLKKSAVSRLEVEMQSRTNEYQELQVARLRTQDAQKRIAALQQVAAHRFLNGNLLNGLQQCGVPDIQVTRVKIEQAYTLTEGTRPRTNASQVIKGKPATATERILLVLEGLDSSPGGQGEQVTRFKEAISTNAYFRDHLARTNGVSLKNMLPAQLSPLTGKPSIPFTLECRYPEKIR